MISIEKTKHKDQNDVQCRVFIELHILITEGLAIETLHYSYICFPFFQWNSSNIIPLTNVPPNIPCNWINTILCFY